MIGRALNSVDEFLAPASVRLFGEGSVLLTFLFHVVLPDEEVTPSLPMDPSLVVTTSGFRRFVDYFLSAGYTFVSPEGIAAGLPSGGRHVLATFDDGYHNNVHALPVLEEFGVPAAFYISTDHVQTGSAFWWDVVYRRRLDGGSTEVDVYREVEGLKSLTHELIREALFERFGAAALVPAGDHDRPMTGDELRAFATHEQVHIGNHTVHHAILTNYREDVLHTEIADAQRYLEKMTGRSPLSISYPNGNHSDEVVAAAVACGLKVGVTTVPEPNRLPLKASKELRIGRFRFDYRTDTPRELAVYRSRHSVGRLARRIRRTLAPT